MLLITLAWISIHRLFFVLRLLTHSDSCFDIIADDILCFRHVSPRFISSARSCCCLLICEGFAWREASKSFEELCGRHLNVSRVKVSNSFLSSLSWNLIGSTWTVIIRNIHGIRREQVDGKHFFNVGIFAEIFLSAGSTRTVVEKAKKKIFNLHKFLLISLWACCFFLLLAYFYASKRNKRKRRKTFLVLFHLQKGKFIETRKCGSSSLTCSSNCLFSWWHHQIR